MGLSLKASGADYSAAAVDFADYPVSTSLVGLFNLGDNEAASLTNLATGGNDATLTAAAVGITYQPGYTVFAGASGTPGAYYQTDLADNASNDRTYVCIERRPSDMSTFRPFVGVFDNAASGGSALTKNGMQSTDGGIESSDWPAGEAANVWRFRAGVINGTKMTAYTGFDGRLLTSTPVTLTRIQNTDTVRIAGTYAAAATVELHMAMAAIHNAALTEAEILQILKYETNRMSDQFGITIQ